MPLYQDLKQFVEKATGIGRPGISEAHNLTRARKAKLMRFRDDGKTPNNPLLPVVLYRTPVRLRGNYDPAAVFEDLFAANGWDDGWRNGIYDHLHFHSRTHEVLAIARGNAEIELGGAKGRVLKIKLGDVIILPAGTGHRRVSASRDLLVVGAYPATGGKYDECTPEEADPRKVRAAISKVPVPAKDPVFGRYGQMTRAWSAQH